MHLLHIVPASLSTISRSAASGDVCAMVLFLANLGNLVIAPPLIGS